VELLLAHETPDEGSQEARHGVKFEEVQEATPQHLLVHGVYNKIAVALKAGSSREVSMQMLAQDLLATVVEDATLPPLASTTTPVPVQHGHLIVPINKDTVLHRALRWS